jgi:Beta-ketoacyl synthase, N-terminal domain
VASSCSAIIVGSAQLLPEERQHGDAARGGPLRAIDPACIEYAVHPRLRRKIDRFSQIALLATSRLERHFADVAKDRVGVFLGNDLAGWNYVHDQLVQLIETADPMAINPYVATAWFPAAAQGEITIAHGILGQSKTFSAGFLSGGLALEYAARMIASNTLDMALAGGVEAPDAPAILLGLIAEQRISLAHPAAEAAGLIALSRPRQTAAARMTISGLRRSAEAALRDIADEFASATTLRYQPPSVDPNNKRWTEILSGIETTLRSQFGARLDASPPPWNGSDVGSASFPLAVIEATRTAATGVPGLVLGSDFDGLYLASAILPAMPGAQ